MRNKVVSGQTLKTPDPVGGSEVRKKFASFEAEYFKISPAALKIKMLHLKSNVSKFACGAKGKVALFEGEYLKISPTALITVKWSRYTVYILIYEEVKKKKNIRHFEKSKKKEH